MTDHYEYSAIATYILNTMKATSSYPSLAAIARKWVVEEGQCLIDDFSKDSAFDPCNEDTDKLVARFEKFTKTHKTTRLGPLQRDVLQLQNILHLDGIETSLLAFALKLNNSVILEHFVEFITDSHRGDALDLAAIMLRCPKSAIARRLHQDGRLCRTGLLAPRTRGGLKKLSGVLNLSWFLYSGLLLSSPGTRSLCTKLLGTPAKANLTWQDFSHLGDAQIFLEHLLKSAAKTRSEGINILLYGPPGTGKTEFCKTLSNQLGLPLYVTAGNMNDYTNDSISNERLQSLQFANCFLKERGKALLLFDEMEDIIPTYRSFTRENAGSKVFLNRLLETNAVPTLWTANNIAAFDKSMLRRMTFVLEMKPPLRRERQKLWGKILENQGMSLPSCEIDALANDFDDAPAIVNTAVKAAKLAGGGVQQIRFAMGTAQKAIGNTGPCPRQQTAGKGFNLAFANADIVLESLTEKLVRPEAPREFSICLYGPPGTGKTAYTRHLAERMGFEVVQVRASDLMTKWVGETEQNIAAAFQRARDEEAFLIFDEADSLLHDRQYAQRSWEVSQVNEMLTWMESHPLPFACTTNLMDRLDAASLRRFTFKIGFDFLTTAQAAACFRHFFGREAPAGLEALDFLTPGDFAVVERRARILGQKDDAEMILSMLCEERAKKPSVKKNNIGYVTQYH